MADGKPRRIWADVVEALHALGTSIAARGHYPAGHAAIRAADETQHALLGKLMVRLPELVVARVAGELVVCERPMPGLRQRVPGFHEALESAGVECLVVNPGVEPAEVTHLATALARPPSAGTDPALERARLQACLPHVLLRFLAAPWAPAPGDGPHDPIALEPLVGALFTDLRAALLSGRGVDPRPVREVARRIVGAARERAFLLRPRVFRKDPAEHAAHATNVAVMSAAMTLEAGLDEEMCVETAAAALLHDVGHFLLPPQVQLVPEPLLGPRGKAVARTHPLLGARILLESGCPALWAAVALEHHRGVDSQGYPPGPPPQAPSRVVALANYVEDKRTALTHDAENPADVLRHAFLLAGRYFDEAWLAWFERALGVFPPGTRVELTAGEVGTVVRANPADPLRPTVLVDATAAHPAARPVDLRVFNLVERRYERSIVRAGGAPR